MIKAITLRNFRNFENFHLSFHPEITYIVGDNGKGKSSLLESLLLMSGNSLLKSKPEILLKIDQGHFFVELETIDMLMSYSYENESKKKQLTVNGKKTSKKLFLKTSPVFCLFNPLSMNIFILAPTKRRDFLDQILCSCFQNYGNILKHYEKILKNRNALLKSVHEGKALEKELNFWDKNFIEAALGVYRYRYILVQFLKENCNTLGKYLIQKNLEISFHYKSKLSFDSPKEELEIYLQSNRARDIIIQKTHIGPHLDDFDIKIEKKSIGDFASRGETKSIILGLKILEAEFIEKHSGKKPIFLIDDFDSELDTNHITLILETLKKYQRVITNITPNTLENSKQIFL